MAHLTINKHASVGATALGLVLSLAGGCKWTEFDDLENETWVTSTGKPNDVSTNFGVAIAQGSQTGTTGGSLVVIGDAALQYTELAYASTGESSLASALAIDLPFANLGPQPILLADPNTDGVALVVGVAGAQGYIVNHSAGTIVVHDVVGSEQPDAATYLRRGPLPPTGPAPALPVLVASGLTVYGQALTGAPATSCVLSLPATDVVTGTDVVIRGIAGASVTSTDIDDVVVWTSDGNINLFPGTVFDGCATPQAPITTPDAVQTGFSPGPGSQIIMTPDRKHAVLVGHKDAGSTDSFLALYDVTAGALGVPKPALVGAPDMTPGLRTAAVLDLSPQDVTDAEGLYVVAGYPREVANSVASGAVRVFPLVFPLVPPVVGMPTGVVEKEFTLHDAEPEANQNFGRSVAVMHFNDLPVIAVAADNEVFVYFETALYTDRRTGR